MRPRTHGMWVVILALAFGIVTTKTARAHNHWAGDASRRDVATRRSRPPASEPVAEGANRASVRVACNVSTPRRLVYVAPSVPAVVGMTGLWGDVVVEFTVEPSGAIANPHVLGNLHMLGRAALAAVAQWKYEPTVAGGEVSCFVTASMPSPRPSRSQSRIAAADDRRAFAYGATHGIDSGYPPLPPPLPPPPGSPWRVDGSDVVPTRLIHVAPIVAELGSEADVCGAVAVELRIDEAGNVADARVVRSLPPLDAAALAAVKQWKYAPTMLNGAPVPVVITVTVNFP